MAPATPPLIVHVFLASPGDVPEERAFVRHYLESILPNDAFLEHRARFEVVSWDHPHAATPMPAHLTPQEAVIRYKRRPADCDIVVVILAGRLGTHLSLDALQRPDGSAYLSGTEWEFEDAWNASPRPDILVYRRKDIPPIELRDPNRDERFRQYKLVEQFFERFKNPDGSWKSSYQEYEGVDDFQAKLASDLKHLVLERLNNLPPPIQPPPDTAPIVPPVRCFGRDDDVTVLVTPWTHQPRPRCWCSERGHRQDHAHPPRRHRPRPHRPLRRPPLVRRTGNRERRGYHADRDHPGHRPQPGIHQLRPGIGAAVTVILPARARQPGDPVGAGPASGAGHAADIGDHAQHIAAGLAPRHCPTSQPALDPPPHNAPAATG
jgi:hypothetical protein